MDTPYETDIIRNTLQRIDKILKEDSTIIIEYPTNETIYHNGFKEIKNKTYGDTSLLFLEK